MGDAESVCENDSGEYVGRLCRCQLRKVTYFLLAGSLSFPHELLMSFF